MLTARPASDCREDRAGIQLSGIARHRPPVSLLRPPDPRPFAVPFHAFRRDSPTVPSTLLDPTAADTRTALRVSLRCSPVASIPTTAAAERRAARGQRERRARTRRERAGRTERECDACANARSRHAVAPKRVVSRDSHIDVLRACTRGEPIAALANTRATRT